MQQHLRPSLVMIIAFTLITGLGYPLAIAAIIQIFAPETANGSLIFRDNKVIGSILVGQAFTSARYFHPRPSATSAPDPNDPTRTVDAPYNGAASAGSNLGPITQKLIDRVKADLESLRAQGVTGPVPADAVTASASGLDPHISPEYARLQVPRVAQARGLAEDQLHKLLNTHIEDRALGVLGEPGVNVLRLNLALDRVQP